MPWRRGLEKTTNLGNSAPSEFNTWGNSAASESILLLFNNKSALSKLSPQFIQLQCMNKIA